MRVSDLVTPDGDAAAPPPARDTRPAPRHEPPPPPPSQQPMKPATHHTQVFQLSGTDHRGDPNGSKAFSHQPVHFGTYRSYTGPGAPPGAPPQQSPTHYHGQGAHQYTFQGIQKPPQQVIQFQHQHPAASPVIRRRRPQSARSLDSPGSPSKSVSKRASTGGVAPEFQSQDANGNAANNVACSVVPGNRSFPCPLSIYGCTSTFGSKNEWKRHVNTQHMRMGFWRCDMCKNGERKPNDFNRKDLFIQHVRRMHPMSATSPATAGLPAPSKSSKDGEDMQMLQTAAARCYKALRHPPEASCCLFCDRTFQGDGTWDDRMEHVGRHLELMRRANEQPPESKDWRADQPMEKWLAQYQVIVPNGNGWLLDDQQLTQKPPRRSSSISQLPKQVMNGINPPPPYPSTAATMRVNQTPVQVATAPAAAPASAPAKVAPAALKVDPPQVKPPQVHPPQPKPLQVERFQVETPETKAPQVKPAHANVPPQVATGHILPTPKVGRLSSPDRLFIAFDEPADASVKNEAAGSSASTSPGTNTDSNAQTNGTEETEITQAPVKPPPPKATRGRAKRNAAKVQAEAGAAEDDPYLSLFNTIPKRKKDTAAGDEEGGELEHESIEDSKTFAGGSERTSRKRKASPAPSTNSFCGSLKDRIYSGFQKAVFGMATSVQRLFVEPVDGQPEAQADVSRATPVAKRTRTARAQVKKQQIDDEAEAEESVEPVRKRQRRGRQLRDDSAAVRESSTSSLSMSTRSSGRVKDSLIQKGVISSRS